MTLPDPEAPAARYLGSDSGPQSIVDQVTDAVLAMILEGELPPGNEVAIKDLSERLNVSHVPVREALRRLESRGLVIFHRGRRPQIAPADVADFDEIFRLRRSIEVEVASRSAGMFDDNQLRILDRCMHDFRASMQREVSLYTSPHTHSQLHIALLPAASRWDMQILTQLWDATERYLQLYVTHERTHPEVIDRIVEEHQGSVDLAAKGGKAFAKGIAAHVDVSISVVRPVIVEITHSRSQAISSPS